MKISIAMTTYNGCRYIEPQLRSITEQSRCPDEIIVCDDGSADGTLEWIETFSLKYPHIRWIFRRNPKNLGWQANFMQAFSMTAGDVILCADQDDIWHPEKIEKMCAVLEADPECELLGCDYILIDETGASAGTKRVLYPPKGQSIEQIPFSPVFYESVRPGCAIAFRRSLLEAAAPYWVEKYPHDELLWNFAILRNTGYVLHEPLLHHRIHSCNVTAPQNTYKERMSMIEVQRCACEQCFKYAHQQGSKGDQLRIIQECIEFFKIRQQALQEHNAVMLLKSLCYFSCYTYRPAFLKDLIYCL